MLKIANMTNRLYPPYFTNTVRFTTFLLSALFFLLASTSASAQGEWKWAHYWSGGDGSYSNYYNKITNIAFDDDGNMYVYGSMGGYAEFDGSAIRFTSSAQVLNRNNRTILLTKFDTTGNMLWYKVVKNSSDMTAPKWMEVRNGHVFISGNTELEYVDWNWNNVWLYYLDTLIRGADVHEIPVENRRPPFQTGRWTFFTTLDLDGNVLDHHFVESFSRQWIHQGNELIRHQDQLSTGFAPTPVHKDNQGNIYVYTPIQYQGVESDSLTLVVDGDSNKTFNLFLPGNADPDNHLSYINNAALYKFSPSGELLSYKLLVDHTDGMGSVYQFNGDSVNKYFTVFLQGMTFDEEDNMYLSGFVRLQEYVDEGGVLHGSELHNYPVHIWWDNTHYSTIQDASSTLYCNFVIKYNTNGDILWDNQIYTRGYNYDYANAVWNGCSYLDNSLYILGTGNYRLSGGALVYFDTEEDSLQRFQGSPSDIGFFVRYNATTGEYVNHGIVPATQSFSGQLPAVINNRIIAYSSVDYQHRFINEWCTNGVYIKTDTIFSSQGLGPTSLIVNENGYLLVSMTATSPVTFDDNISVNCSSTHSSAVFALYHDPEFATPFVSDDSVGIEDYLDRRESDIYISPNPTSGPTFVCGYMYGYKNIELFDMQGRKLGVLFEAQDFAMPYIDLSPYPAGTYIVKINFERGVSVVRKVVKN